jgi:hypothetical protein
MDAAFEKIGKRRKAKGKRLFKGERRKVKGERQKKDRG